MNLIQKPIIQHDYQEMKNINEEMKSEENKS